MSSSPIQTRPEQSTATLTESQLLSSRTAMETGLTLTAIPTALQTIRTYTQRTEPIITGMERLQTYIICRFRKKTGLS